MSLVGWWGEQQRQQNQPSQVQAPLKRVPSQDLIGPYGEPVAWWQQPVPVRRQIWADQVLPQLRMQPWFQQRWNLTPEGLPRSHPVDDLQIEAQRQMQELSGLDEGSLLHAEAGRVQGETGRSSHQNAVFPIPEGQRPFIPVRMCGDCGCQTVNMMVDTGNDISLLNRQDAQRICLKPDRADRMIRVAGISQSPMGFDLFGHVPVQIGQTDPVTIPVAVGDVRDNLLGREGVRHDFDIFVSRNQVSLRRYSDVPIANTDRYHSSELYRLGDTHSHTHGRYKGGYV
jgi:hypothetical protein